MKINWGMGIVIAFALFMSFILYFVVKVQSDSKYDNELVVKEYYKKDMRYGEEIQQMQNAANLSRKPRIISAVQGIAVQFPDDMRTENISGSVSLYRPSASRMDFEVPLELSGPQLLIPDSFLAAGLWDITVRWQYEGKKYMMKQRIFRRS